MQVEVSKRAQHQWLRILVYYNEMGGERAAAKLHQKYLQKQKRLLKYPESGSPEQRYKIKRRNARKTCKNCTFFILISQRNN